LLRSRHARVGLRLPIQRHAVGPWKSRRRQQPNGGGTLLAVRDRSDSPIYRRGMRPPRAGLRTTNESLPIPRPLQRGPDHAPACPGIRRDLAPPGRQGTWAEAYLLSLSVRPSDSDQPATWPLGHAPSARTNPWVRCPLAKRVFEGAKRTAPQRRGAVSHPITPTAFWCRSHGGN